MYPTQIYQNEIAVKLENIYPAPIPINVEWRAIDNIAGLYSPRIDIAVGPYSTERGGNQIDNYNELMDLSGGFIKSILNYHMENVEKYGEKENLFNIQKNIPDITNLKYFNENARCLLAIEIENKVSRKHLLGGAVNASALGRIGIVIGWTEEKVKALVKLQAYWHFLDSVRKNSFRTDNLFILSREQMNYAILKNSNKNKEIK